MAEKDNFSELCSEPLDLGSYNDTIHNTSSRPGPAMGGCFYKDDPQHPSLIFTFCPDPCRHDSLRCQDWVAVLEVKCPDIPRLMREGFHWNTSNVIKEESYIEFGDKGGHHEFLKIEIVFSD